MGYVVSSELCRVCLHRGLTSGSVYLQITRVHFPGPLNGRDRKIAYVEFGDEDAMKAGLEKHKKVCPMVPSCPLSTRSTDCIFTLGTKRWNS